MCLLRVDVTYAPLSEAEAWKIFAVREGKLTSPFFHKEGQVYEEGQWYARETTCDLIRSSDGNHYPPGFHAYVNKHDAYHDATLYQGYFSHRHPLVVRKVKLRGVHTKGVEYGPNSIPPTYVAQEMLIEHDCGAGEKEQ